MTKFYLFLGGEEHQPERLVELGREAEAAGFDGLMVSEHFHPWVDDAGAAGFTLSTLGALASVTKNLELMTAVTTPLWRYHPALMAQAAATIDRLSNGRFSLGVGTGENINEGPLGYAFPAYKERAARMREALEIMRRLLDGETLTFEGTYYRTDRAKLYSPPLHHVPLYLAAGGPKSAALAADMADGVVVSVKDVAETRERVVDAAGDGTIVATRWVVYADTDEDAWVALQPWRGLRAPDRLKAVDPADLREAADSMPREEILGKYARAATPDELVDQYKPLVEDLGADIVGMPVASLNPSGTISMLGDHVLPALREIQ